MDSSIRLILFDRDGTLNKDENGYTHKLEDCTIYQDVLDFFQILSRDVIVLVVSNQSGIGRGYYTENDFHKFNDKLNELVTSKTNHIGISKFYFCPHTPSDKCKCRKPSSLMLESAIRDYEVDPNETIMIGDKISDMTAGINAGIKSLLINRSSEYEFQLIKAQSNSYGIISSLTDLFKIYNFKGQYDL